MIYTICMMLYTAAVMSAGFAFGLGRPVPGFIACGVAILLYAASVAVRRLTTIRYLEP